LAASLGKYRGFFILLTLLLLGISHYFMRKQTASKSSKVILWISTAVSVSILIYTIIQG